jgi:DNA-binding protein Fis
MKDQSSDISDYVKLFKQVENKLENIVEQLLISKVNDNDNVLQSIQTMTEKVFIACAMKISHDNISQASKLLGINRNTLSKKLKEVEIKNHTYTT